MAIELYRKNTLATFNIEVKMMKITEKHIVEGVALATAFYLLTCKGMMVAFFHKGKVVVLKGIKHNGKSDKSTALAAIEEYKANH